MIFDFTFLHMQTIGHNYISEPRSHGRVFLEINFQQMNDTEDNVGNKFDKKSSSKNWNLQRNDLRD